MMRYRSNAYLRPGWTPMEVAITIGPLMTVDQIVAAAQEAESELAAWQAKGGVAHSVSKAMVKRVFSNAWVVIEFQAEGEQP